MTESRFTCDDLLRRLEALERRQRWWQRLALGLAALAALAIGVHGCMQKTTTTPTVASKNLTAEKLVLADAAGNVRATLGGDGLILNDSTGKPRVELHVLQDVPTLRLLDADSRTRAELALTKEGAGLTLLDDQGRKRTRVALRGNVPVVTMTDEEDKPHVEIVVEKKTPKLTMTGAKGQEKVVLSAADGQPTVQLTDDGGVERVAMAISSRKEPVFLMNDARGKRRAELRVDRTESYLALADANHNTRLTLTAAVGTSGIGVSDDDGKVRLQAIVQNNEPVVSLKDAGQGNDVPRLRLAISAEGSGLSLTDELGDLRGRFQVDKDGAKITLFDDSGNPVFEKPGGKE